MPFSTAETRDGARLIGADRATWLRLAAALTLGAAALAAPHVGGTQASFTDSTTVGTTLSTCSDFSAAPDCPPPAAPSDDLSTPADAPPTGGQPAGAPETVPDAPAADGATG